jgi:O-antigen ligase
MVLVVLTEQDPLGAIRAVLRRVYLVHIPLSIATIKWFRSIGVGYSDDGLVEMWTGLTTHKNNLGQVAMCSGIVSTWQILQNWARAKPILDVLLLVLTLWILRGSKTNHSSTAIVGFVVGIAVLFALHLVRKRVAHVKRIVLTGGIAFLVVALWVHLAFAAFDVTPIELVVEATGRDMTFTDRTYIWQDLLINAAKHPVLGVGIGAFWVGPIGYAMYPMDNWHLVTKTWRPGEGHNGYLDVYVELGMIGVALVLLVIGYAFYGALNDLENNFELGRIRLTLLMSIVVNNLTESSFLRGPHSLWFVFLLVAVNAPAVTRRLQLRKAARVHVITPRDVPVLAPNRGANGLG